MNRAMNYVEQNLLNKIDAKEVAKLACCSEYHFPRMFSSITGFTLSEYIRRRRLSQAACELQNDKTIRIIDLALKFGYDSPDAFSRAFKNLHGVSPTAARCNGVELKMFPKISFQIMIKGDVEMEYRLEILDDDIEIIGLKKEIMTEDAFRTIPILWEEATTNGFLQKLINMSWENPQCKLEGLLGVCGKQAAITDETFYYMMGCRFQGEYTPDMEKIVIPKSTWVVFPDVSKAWKRFYTEWLPASEYELADLPCIENYLAPDLKPSSELWVPVVQK